MSAAVRITRSINLRGKKIFFCLQSVPVISTFRCRLKLTNSPANILILLWALYINHLPSYMFMWQATYYKRMWLVDAVRMVPCCRPSLASAVFRASAGSQILALRLFSQDRR